MDGAAFAQGWCEAWNAHDVERVLAHFGEDVVFTSPVAARLRPASGGRLHGKAALRDYWQDALRLIPDLRFMVEQVFEGPSMLVIQYRNQRGVRVAEVLEFADGLVRRGHGTYPIGATDPAGFDASGPRVGDA